MGNRREYLINQIVAVCNKLDAKGFGANHDGNVSARYEDVLLATPTSESKGDIVAEMILTLDMEGQKVAGIGKSFSEIKLHLAAYLARPEIKAVVHAHPPFAMARGLVGGDFQVMVPEAVVSLGDVVPVAGYAFPGAEENNRLVAESLSRSDVFIMAGNGIFSTGRDPKEAYLRLELVEHLLKIDSIAQPMGTQMSIPSADREKLLQKRADLGLGPQQSAPPQDPPRPAPDKDVLKEMIAREVRDILKETKK